VSSNLDKLRGVLGIVGGRESEVLGIAIRRIKELEGKVEQLEGQLTEQDQQLDRMPDETL
jgi:hypothetical protein